VLKAKLQLESGSGILLLTGPPSTGKSAFLKYAASIMNREYFEHASDKWQTKNSLVTAIKFGEFGPYSVPAGFTKAITTPNSLINIEEIKEIFNTLILKLKKEFSNHEIEYGERGTFNKINYDDWRITKLQDDEVLVKTKMGFLNHEISDLRNNVFYKKELSHDNVNAISSLLFELSIQLKNKN